MPSAAQTAKNIDSDLVDPHGFAWCSAEFRLNRSLARYLWSRVVITAALNRREEALDGHFSGRISTLTM